MQILNFVAARFQAGLRISKGEIADYYNRSFREDFQRLGLSYDLFSRTTTHNHELVVQVNVQGVVNCTHLALPYLSKGVAPQVIIK